MESKLTQTRTGLVTFHAAHHYGAMLQAYALAKAVQPITGHCELADYRRPHTVRTNRVLRPGFSPGTLIKNAHSLLRYPALKRRYNRFTAFLTEKMPLSPDSYSSMNEMESLRYDLYLSGSDKIWNPFIYDDGRFDPVFFSAYAKNGRKIAYAPSLGPKPAEGRHRDELKSLLEGFSHLSSREEEGAAILRDLTGLPVPVVLDPTLLLTAEEWAAAAEKGEGERYILCYFLSNPGGLPEKAADLKKKYRLPVLQLGSRRGIPAADRVVLDAGPREFLSLVKNAEYVLTDSFHGAVFSVIFHRALICSEGRGEGGGKSRIGGLLQILGLEERLHTIGPTGISENRLKAERARSLEYLRNALNV